MESTQSSSVKGKYMEARIIRTPEEYNESLSEVERLIALDPAPGTYEAERLDVLAMLLETYEKQHFPFEAPDPIEAIRFRMEEQGLMQRDLIPYIGSKSKVSEVLSGKRSLTLQMIRAINKGLDIPLEILMQEPKKQQIEPSDWDWQQLPFMEMIKRKWVKANAGNSRNNVAVLVQNFLEPLGGYLPDISLCRRSLDGENDVMLYSLLAWAVRVLVKTKSEDLSDYKPGTVTRDFIKQVVSLSWSNQGPLLAKEFLSQHGIALIVEPHLPKTKLDGMATISDDGRPVIGLTIRYDRIDNFWFTLIHELSHVAQHFGDLHAPFIDDLDGYSDDPKEKEANKLTSEILIPTASWKSSRAWQQKTPSAVEDFAKELGIHPAIVAGRIRRESNNYGILSDMLGNGEVRRMFPDVEW